MLHFHTVGQLVGISTLGNRLTLEQWAHTFGVPIETLDDATYVVPQDQTAIVELYRLSDYRVSSRCGPVVWLCPALTS